MILGGIYICVPQANRTAPKVKSMVCFCVLFFFFVLVVTGTSYILLITLQPIDEDWLVQVINYGKESKWDARRRRYVLRPRL